MREQDSDLQVTLINRLVADLFSIVSVHRQGKQYHLALDSHSHRERSTKLLRERLSTAGYSFSLDSQEQSTILTIDPNPKVKIPPLNIALFIATLFSVYFVPVFFGNLGASGIGLAPDEPLGYYDQFLALMMLFTEAWKGTLHDLATGAGVEFTIAMISILLIHEMGHYIAGRRRQIVTSWPYFIPAPNIIGTFGAIIKSKSPFWNRRDLIEVGAAGPIAGWIVAIGWLVYGLSHSIAVAPDSVPANAMVFSLEGESILMRFLAPLLAGPLGANQYYVLTEAAFAGWVGLLVTAINLLPIGQLDGGHITYGLGRTNQYVLGRIALLGLLILGFTSPMWWLFAGFGLFFGVKHPQTIDDERKPSATAVILGIVSIGILIVSFTPIPFR